MKFTVGGKVIPCINDILSKKSTLCSTSLDSTLLPNWSSDDDDDDNGESRTSVIRYVVLFQVQYNINGWLDKNKDPIQECVIQLMQESKEPLVATFFREPEEGLQLILTSFHSFMTRLH